jgi:tetratricopeptide (TPR) repeat protein
MFHKPTGRELLYRNPVFQPADFALNGAWFSGGIEWNIGATGHTTLSCAPLHAARVTAPDGGDMLRLWEWERLRDLPFQVDLWLPAGSDFLHVGVRIRNPHERPAPVYWWSNIAVPEEHRVLAPADEAWHFGYERSLRRVPVPESDGVDRSYPLSGEFPADYFYEVPDGQRRWIAALDDDGHGLVQTSTDLLRGRKLFLWGHGAGGRRWQEWLTEPGTGGYAEIQAGLARTQLEHVRLDAEGEFAWLESYGPLSAAPDAVHSAEDWGAARGEVEERLEAALPRADVDAAYAAWRPHADAEPEESLAEGSGWGALEVLRGDFKLPGTPFAESALGPEQAPWLDLLRTGSIPEPRRVGPPGPTLVAAHWRDMLETAPAQPLTEYHLGVAQWHAGDLAQAVRSWERGLELAPSLWPLLRCLAVADQEAGHHERAADRYAEAFDDLCQERRDDGEAWTAATAALGREAIDALLAARRPGTARTVWDRLHATTRARGRFRLVEARLLIAEGDKEAARAVFDEGFEVADLREGSEVIAELWARLAAPGERLPAQYDFSMRPRES